MANTQQIPEGKRITLKRSRPNPLFEEWVEKMYDEAREKKSKLEPMLKEALTSLSKYPLPLQSGAECSVLQGFDRKLCKFLDRHLEQHNQLNSIPGATDVSVITLPESRSSSEISINGNSLPSPPMSKSNKKKKADHSSKNTVTTEIITSQHDLPLNSATSTNSSKKTRVYKPAFRSGSYAILCALFENTIAGNTQLSKDELIDIAQKYCEESFVRPKPDTFYTAWSSMSTLVKKGLVQQTKNKIMWYSLTDPGRLLAKELFEESETTPTLNDMIFKTEPTNDIAPIAEPRNVKAEPEDIDVVPETPVETVTLRFPLSSYDIILLIDKNETGGLSKKNDPTVAQFKKYPDLKHEYRSLKVGDFIWIARHRENALELVLPFVVERKRMDDLGASIKDGRFHEQKFRLRKCGAENVIYLVENYGSNKHVGLPIQSLKQALANTRIHDRFQVHFTDSLSDSVKFLALMTRSLIRKYKEVFYADVPPQQHCNGEIQSMTFNFFNRASSKTKPLTVTETFIKILLQLKGVSVDKALAITQAFGTPRLLLEEYQKITQKEGETLLANLKYGDLQRKIGPKVSKSIYQLFFLDG